MNETFHEDTESKSYGTFLIMERKLLKYITVPAMILTYIFGIICAYIYGIEALGMWFHIKTACVLALTISNGMLAICYKNLLYKRNKYSAKFFKIINEIPTILMILAVFMVVLKPLVFNQSRAALYLSSGLSPKVNNAS